MTTNPAVADTYFCVFEGEEQMNTRYCAKQKDNTTSVSACNNVSQLLRDQNRFSQVLSLLLLPWFYRTQLTARKDTCVQTVSLKKQKIHQCCLSLSSGSGRQGGHLLSCCREVFRHPSSPHGGHVRHEEVELFLVRPVEDRSELGEHRRCV